MADNGGEMQNIRCVDVVTFVTDEATKEFAPLLRESECKKSKLKEYCDIIDLIVENNHCGTIEAEVEDGGGHIRVCFSSDKFEIDPHNESIQKVYTASSKVRLYPDNDDGSVVIEFVFDGIWEDLNQTDS